MNKNLNLFKDKLPKRKRHKTDDDLFVEGMYHPFLDTRGYEVEAVQENNINTSEKGVTADFPELENLGWMFDSEVKDDYQSLLKDRRDKMTQTFRYMLEQNNSSSVTSFSGSSPSDRSRESSRVFDERPQNLTRSNTKNLKYLTNEAV